MKCRDIAREFGVTPMTVGRRRRRMFPKAEVKSDLNEDEVTALRAYYREFQSLDDSPESRKEMEELVKPQFVEAFVAFVRDGNRKVMCKAREKDGRFSEPFMALMPFNSKAKRGDMVRLECLEWEDGTKQYRHEFLAGRAWGNVK